MSIKKVANIAGVSIATVSRFFNNPNLVSKKTRDKVEKAIKHINYTPNTLAQNLRRGKTGLIIVVAHKVSSPFYDAIIEQLNQSALNNNYNLFIKQASFNSLPLSYYQNMIRCKQADGFIILTGLAEKQVEEIDNNLPIVIACEPSSLGVSLDLTCISINHYLATKEATHYLIDIGHKNIAFIAGENGPATIEQQKAGFKDAMYEAKLGEHARILTDDEEVMSFHNKLARMFESNVRPTACFCADDFTSIKTLHSLKRLGLSIPKDISIIGFNNTPFTDMADPPLSTVQQPMKMIATKSMEVLINLISGESKVSKIITLDHKLVIRKSTSPVLLKTH